MFFNMVLISRWHIPSSEGITAELCYLLVGRRIMDRQYSRKKLHFSWMEYPGSGPEGGRTLHFILFLDQLFSDRLQ